MAFARFSCRLTELARWTLPHVSCRPRHSMLQRFPRLFVPQLAAALLIGVAPGGSNWSARDPEAWNGPQASVSALAVSATTPPRASPATRVPRLAPPGTGTSAALHVAGARTGAWATVGWHSWRRSCPALRIDARGYDATAPPLPGAA